MDGRHRLIRAMLSTMSPRRAVEYVKAFGLPSLEEACIIEADIRKRSLVDISITSCLSVDTIKKYRRSGYRKMADELKNA